MGRHGAYFADRRLAVSAIAVLIYGLLLGDVVWYTFFGHVPHTYPLSWQASWITYPGEEISQSYYRKKIYLTERVRHAWIKIMAPDSFEFYVNGRLLGARSALSQNTSEVFDLTGSLEPGENLLAISNHRSTYPGTSQIVAEGVYEDWHGVKHPIAADSSWKVAPFQEQQLYRGPIWFEIHFNDVTWKKPIILTVPQPEDHSTVPYNPLLYITDLRGRWSWSPDSTTQQVYFRRAVDLPKRPKDAWLRIAARGSYHLLINGVAIAREESQIGDLQAVSRQALKMYEVSPFLHPGRNIIAVRAYGERANRGLLVDGVITDREGGQEWFSTPKGWKCATGELPGWISPRYDDGSWKPPEALGGMTTPEEINVRKKIESAQVPGDHATRLLLKQAMSVLFIVPIIFLLWFW